jgi:DNA-binding transcriptional LysR family regulator
MSAIIDDLRPIRVFLEVARQSSFAVAARNRDPHRCTFGRKPWPTPARPHNKTGALNLDWSAIAPLWLTLFYPPYEQLPPLAATFSDFFEAYLRKNEATSFNWS